MIFYHTTEKIETTLDRIEHRLLGATTNREATTRWIGVVLAENGRIVASAEAESEAAALARLNSYHGNCEAYCGGECDHVPVAFTVRDAHQGLQEAIQKLKVRG